MLSFANCKLASAIFRLVGGSCIYTHFLSPPFQLVSSFKEKYLLVVEVHFLHVWGGCKSAQQTLSCLITGSSSSKGHVGMHGPVAHAWPAFGRPLREQWPCNFPPPVHRGSPGVSWHDEGWSTPHSAVLCCAWASTGTPDSVCSAYTQSHTPSASLPCHWGIPQRTACQ